MNKIRNLISVLLGLVALAGLVVGLAWLLGPQGVLPGQQVSPVRTPTLIGYEPTAPSEDWPTLTPPPTWPPLPTPRGTPVLKPTSPPMPTPTRPPVLLTPIPGGTPPADLSWLYYVADTETGPELRVIGMDNQGRRWSESAVASSGLAWNLWGLYPSPDGAYLAAQTAGDGRAVYVIDLSSGRVSCVLDEPVGCRGDFHGWTLDNQLLFQPLDPQPGTLRAKFGVVLVDFRRAQYKELDLPVDSKGYSVANNLTLNADSSKIAYSTTDWATRQSAIWTRGVNEGEGQLVHTVPGWIVALSWSPVGEQLFFLNVKGAASDPAELWIMNSDGSDARLLSQKVPKATEWRYRPTWSPDGRCIVFVQVDAPSLFSSLDEPGGKLAEPGTNIYVADTVTGKVTRLSSFNDKRNTSFPTWSPDSRFVAFVSTIIADKHTRYGEIWVAGVDGSQLYAVSGTAKPYNALAWLSSTPTKEVEAKP